MENLSWPTSWRNSTHCSPHSKCRATFWHLTPEMISEKFVTAYRLRAEGGWLATS